MKIVQNHSRRRTERGMITVVFIALLVIMMILVTAETRALIQLRREVNLMQKHQIQRLDFSPTNATTIAQSESK